MSVIRQPDPIIVLSPIDTDVVAFIVLPEMPTLLPIIILLPSVFILNKQGCMSPIEFELNLLLHYLY